MNHRNGKPKTNASERTMFRWRVRNDLDTSEDKLRTSRLEDLKHKWADWMNVLKQTEPAIEP